MKQFFKFMFASILGVFLSLFIIFLVVGGIFAGIVASADKDKEPKIDENSILHLQLNKQIMDRPSNNPLENFNFSTFEDESPNSLSKIIENIEKASRDERIKGIYLNVKSLKANLSSTDAIRTALEEFKASGKFILAYSESYGQQEYYLNSVADEVYLNPAGGMIFKGLAAELMFFKDALSRIEIDMQVIRHGKFKSAIEPFIRNDMSPENEAQLSQLINGIWNFQLDRISKDRKVSKDILNTIADSLLIRTAEDALAYELVDGLLYEDEVRALLKQKAGISDENEKEDENENEEEDEDKDKDKEESELALFNDDDDDLILLSLKDFSKVKKVVGADMEKLREKRRSKNKIAVVFAEGEIISGESRDGQMGSTTIAKAIKEAREDDMVKAIVLRVNSPGGSALASDVIWRETMLAKAKKPLIVSMGDLAASGGYYISCGADKIYAEEATITGSIGVFGVIPNMQGMLNNKLGIYTDQVGTNNFSDGVTILRPLAETERAAIQEMIEDIYDDFTSKVAAGRDMSQASVDSIGQGRVWSGMDAIGIGLVDELGGLEEAIVAAASMAEVETYKIKDLPKQEDPMQKLLSELSSQAYIKVFGFPMMTKAERYYKSIEQAFEAEGIYTRMPVEIIIK